MRERFMTLGLTCSALIMIFMGMVPFATTSAWVMFALLLANGWFQGMGWPPSGRVMVHWFSQGERGIWMSFWNVAHNVGGGMVGLLAILGMRIFGDWHSILYFHGIIALFVAIWIFLTVRDTPQSQGLPTNRGVPKGLPNIIWIQRQPRARVFGEGDIFRLRPEQQATVGRSLLRMRSFISFGMVS